MKFTLSWLKTHIDINLDYSVEDICKKLDEIGLEVESCEDRSQKYKNFIIAEVISAEQHPNADSLKVCKVNTGSEVLNIVCGAPNARAGIKVVLAKIDAIVPNGSFIIKKSTIRGAESEGMLCSAEELGLIGDIRFESSDGIIEIDSKAEVGMPFSKYAGIDEIIIEVSLTLNRRKDSASVYGIARDLAAAGVGKLKSIDNISYISSNELPEIKVQIDAKDHCYQFNCFTCADQKIIKHEESAPLSHIKELHNNPLVNISNFLMFDLGHPNHIYDLDKIAGDKIYVKLSDGGEEFIALGGQSYILPKDILIISDSEKVLCVAGVMGGELSKVDENTKNILVEVANFKQETVAFAGQKLKITSDSRLRFEGGIDHDFIDIFTEKMMSCFEACSAIQKVYGTQNELAKEIEISIENIERYIGISVDEDEIYEMLTRLSFNPRRVSGGVLEVTIPSWKQGNIETYHDVIGDILRIGLIDKINSTNSNRRLIRSTDVKSNMIESINGNSSDNILNPRVIIDSTGSKLRQRLLSRGIHEVLTWSFYSELDETDFSIEENHISNYCIKSQGDAVELVKLVNPLNNNFTYMRRSIIPNLVKILCKNPNNKEKSFSVFETGNIYSNFIDNMQSFCVAGLRGGDIFKNSIHNKNRCWSFFDVREDFLSLLGEFGMSGNIVDYSIDSEVPKYYHPSKSIRIKLGNIVLGICGELHPNIIKKFDINHSSVAIFELFTHNIPIKGYKIKQYKPLIISNYQKIKRDLAFILDSQIRVGDIIKTINSLKEKLIDDVEVFDLYNGIAEGKKSIAFSFEIQPTEANITDEIINGLMNKVIKAIQDKHNGILRDK